MNVALNSPKSVLFLFRLERKFFPKKEVTLLVVRTETPVSKKHKPKPPYH